MPKQPPATSQPSQIRESIDRRLFQIVEALSLEERILLKNPSGLSRAADSIEEFFSRVGPLFTVKERHKNCLRMKCGLTWTNATEIALKALCIPRAQTTLIPLPRLSLNLRPLPLPRHRSP